MADEPTIGGSTGEANPGFDHIAIPDLKKKQKEKKGTGAAVAGNAPSAANPVGAALQGASAGGLEAAGVSAGAAAGAAGLSASGGLAGFAALLGSKIGIAALALALAGLGFVGYTALKMGQNQGNKPGSPHLGGLSSDIKIAKRDAEGSRSLDIMAKSSKGEIDWDSTPGVKKDAPKKADEAAEVDAAAKAADGGGSPTPEAFPEKTDRAKLTGELSGAKLSNGLGNSSFGGHDIFKGGGTGFKPTGLANMSKNGGNLASSANRGGKMGAPRGQLGGMKGSRGLMARNITTRNNGLGNALGQAKFADGMSKAGAAAGSETEQRNMTADAFDGQSTTGGGASGIGGGSSGLGTAASLGTGAPGNEGETWSGNNYTGTGYTAPSMPNVGDQNKKDTGLITACQALIFASATLILVGSALVLAGEAEMEACPECPCPGAAMVAIGEVLCGIAAALGAVIAVLAAFMSDSQMMGTYIGIGAITVACAFAGMAGGGWAILAEIMGALMMLGSLVAMIMGA